MSTTRSKNSKKMTTKKVEPRSTYIGGNVTISDFANSPRPYSRLKKATVKVSSEVKQVITVQSNPNETWDEIKGLEIDEALGNCSLKDRRRRKQKVDEGIEEGGVHYPLDIWFIISEYIPPEAVGKFARICKSSYYVVSTGKFWFHLYKSFYKPVPGLPERLKPQCMVRQHGLRVAVIRTLHYTYFALRREKGLASCLQQEDPHSLVKRRCTLMWHSVCSILLTSTIFTMHSVKEGKVRWHFFFKFKEMTRKHKPYLRESERSDETHFFDTPEDVTANPEEGCKLLQVVSSKYTMLPLVIGMFLQKVNISLMPGFKEQKLQLGFGTSDLPNSQTVQIVLNEVIDYQILNWWHPCYPHQDIVSEIQLNTRDSWEKM